MARTRSLADVKHQLYTTIGRLERETIEDTDSQILLQILQTVQWMLSDARSAAFDTDKIERALNYLLGTPIKPGFMQDVRAFGSLMRDEDYFVPVNNALIREFKDDKRVYKAEYALPSDSVDVLKQIFIPLFNLYKKPVWQHTFTPASPEAGITTPWFEEANNAGRKPLSETLKAIRDFQRGYNIDGKSFAGQKDENIIAALSQLVAKTYASPESQELLLSFLKMSGGQELMFLPTLLSQTCKGFPTGNIFNIMNWYVQGDKLVFNMDVTSRSVGLDREEGTVFLNALSDGNIIESVNPLDLSREAESPARGPKPGVVRMAAKIVLDIDEKDRVVVPRLAACTLISYTDKIPRPSLTSKLEAEVKQTSTAPRPSPEFNQTSTSATKPEQTSTEPQPEPEKKGEPRPRSIKR